MTKIYRINIPVLEANLDVYIGDKMDAKDKIIKKYNVSLDVDRIERALAYTTELASRTESIYIIILDKDIGLDMNTIYHEALHVTNWLLDFFGIIVETNNHEIQCYYQSYIAKRIIECVTKYNLTYGKKTSKSKKCKTITSGRINKDTSHKAKGEVSRHSRR